MMTNLYMAEAIYERIFQTRSIKQMQLISDVHVFLPFGPLFQWYFVSRHFVHIIKSQVCLVSPILSVYTPNDWRLNGFCCCCIFLSFPFPSFIINHPYSSIHQVGSMNRFPASSNNDLCLGRSMILKTFQEVQQSDPITLAFLTPFRIKITRQL